ncbi:Zinc finger protein 331 [Dissostichus eleginoides]|uniref:Zinc finger protein 331 n=1 Tax=Dissostichus eleginoides TaxID=100907 RepID=A0AAD9CGL1_DISEL|nr:Zinc finger protein 331 [Dissostichus eleginoides]
MALSLQGVGTTLQQRLCEERILTLGQVVEAVAPLDNAAGLASRLSLRSVRVISLLLQSWRQQLSQSELETAAQPVRAGDSSSAIQSWKQQLSQSELETSAQPVRAGDSSSANQSWRQQLSQSELETAAQPFRAGNTAQPIRAGDISSASQAGDSSSASQSCWRQQLSQSELETASASQSWHCNGLKFTNDNDSFPEMRCFPDLSCDVFLLKLNNVTDFKFSTMSNKTVYYLVIMCLFVCLFGE